MLAVHRAISTLQEGHTWSIRKSDTCAVTQGGSGTLRIHHCQGALHQILALLQEAQGPGSYVLTPFLYLTIYGTLCSGQPAFMFFWCAYIKREVIQGNITAPSDTEAPIPGQVQTQARSCPCSNTATQKNAADVQPHGLNHWTSVRLCCVSFLPCYYIKRRLRFVIYSNLYYFIKSGSHFRQASHLRIM